MDWSIKKNLNYAIAIFVFFFAIPHVLMSVVPFPPLEWKRDEATEAWASIRMYGFCIWGGVPLSGGIIALRHVLSGGKFCPSLIIEAALALLTYFVRIEARFVFRLLPALLIILLMECFALLPPCDQKGYRGERLSILSGMAVNRRYLAQLCFWSVVLIGVIQIASSFFAVWPFRQSILSVVILLPLPLILLILTPSEFEGIPLTTGGVVGVLGIFTLSCLLCTTFYMNHFWKVHLICVIISYGLMLLMEVLGAQIRRRRPR